MRALVLLKLLNELGKEIKCEACRAFYPFFCNECLKGTATLMITMFYMKNLN